VVTLGLAASPPAWSSQRGDAVAERSPAGETARLAQKLAQLLIVSFEDADLSADDVAMLRDTPPGGVVLYKRHMVSDEQVRALTSRIVNLAPGSPPFIAVDQEHGSVKRLPFTEGALPGNMALGATRSRALAREAGAATGARLRALGIHVNFAPVLDVARNPRATIGTRSFGDDPELVAELGVAFMDGQSAAGVASVVKHFVGEGAAAGDTHLGPAVLTDSAEHIRALDVLPFRAAIRAGVPAVMTSHIGAPALTGEGNGPITYSHQVVTGLLRDELRFGGVVMTDALEMQAARTYDQQEELALWAIEAGADMIVVNGSAAHRKRVLERLCAAYRNGRLTRARVDASLRRIAAFRKIWSAPAVVAVVRSDLAERIAAASVTLIGAAPLPLVRPSAGDVVVVESDRFFGTALDLCSVEPPQRPLELWSGVPTDGWRVVLAVFATPEQAAAASRWIRRNAPRAAVVGIALGDPRDVRSLDHYDAAVFGYSGSPDTRAAVLAVLLDGAPAHGELPVHVDRR
jgi:beta-N-acetylhexosaminidase